MWQVDQSIIPMLSLFLPGAVKEHLLGGAGGADTLWLNELRRVVTLFINVRLREAVVEGGGCGIQTPRPGSGCAHRSARMQPNEAGRAGRSAGRSAERSAGRSEGRSAGRAQGVGIIMCLARLHVHLRPLHHPLMSLAVLCRARPANARRNATDHANRVTAEIEPEIEPEIEAEIEPEIELAMLGATRPLHFL